MNLRLLARVVLRFKYLVVAGTALAVMLSVLTVAKFAPSHGAPYFASRTTPIYASDATVLVTQSGFPWGSAIQQYATSSSGSSPVPAGDLDRLTSLAGLYVQLVNSDLIRSLAAQHIPKASTITASQNYSMSPSYYSTAMPIVTISGTGGTRQGAALAAQAGVDALREYVVGQERGAGITGLQRVVVQELKRPQSAYVVNGPKKTLPVVVFFTIMLAVIGLAFAMENVWPRQAEGPGTVSSIEQDPLRYSARHSA